MTSSTLAERLQKAMDRAGLNQAQLEIEAQLGKGYLSRPLAGQRAKIDVQYLERIAGACEVSFKWLSTGKGPMLGSDVDESAHSESEPAEQPTEDTSPLVRALFRVMNPDAYTEQDFRAARRALVETYAFAKEGTSADDRAKQALDAARSLRLDGLLVTNAGIASRIAWGKPSATTVARESIRQQALDAEDAAALERARNETPKKKR